ncbi:MAG: hypothetical protein RBS99_18680 [Rhodospirillales bacterium]|jgi:hypothetical protein|nr:hypothetical protein [Rhodospirillales bacterium]
MYYCKALFDELDRLAVDRAGEIALVRELAARTVALARSENMDRIRRRWRDVLAMRKPDRPPVWCHGNASWNEIMPESELVCRDRLCRELEGYFKRILVKDAIGDDTPVNDYFMLNTVLDVTPANVWGLDIEHETLAAEGSAWRYRPTLATDADFDRLVVPAYRVNAAATAERQARLADILGGVMPVRVSPVTGFFSIATLCSPAAHLRGLEPMMIDLIEAPERVHRLIGTILRGEQARLDAIERSGVEILPNTDTPMLFSDPIRPENPGPFSFRDCWIHGNSQEFDQVSPAMFDAFLLNYQKPLFARFGAVCYGCCENLTRKLDQVLTIPNLRLLTCSAWTDLPTLVAKAGDRCCIMWRHKASEVACADDLGPLAKRIREQARILNGCSYQVVLREMQTLMGHPDRLREWAQLAIEAVS